MTKEKKTAWDGAATHAGSAHAPVNSERNTIISIKKNGSAVPINEDRSVDISVPTKVSQLANDAGYKTTDNNTTYSLGVAANSSANGTAKIRLTGSDTKTTDIAIKGAGSTSVTTDAEGNLIVTSADTKYTHPTGDGNLHVPATGTTNNGKVLKAGATAGSAAWAQLTKADVGLGNVDNTSDATKSVASAAKLTTARNINVGGAVTATAASFNGSADATINVTSLNAAKLVLNSGDVLILDGSINYGGGYAMEATIKVQLKQAVKTESQWRSSNPVIPDGCMAITSDRGNAYKVGDGSSEWNDLSYNTAIAQDVYSWAKQEGKPSYTKSEVGLGNVDNKSSEQIRAELTKKM